MFPAGRIQNQPLGLLPLPIREARNEIVQKLALQTLAELAISLAIGLVVAAFVATPFGLVTLATTVIIQTIFNLVVRGIGANASFKALEGGPDAERYQKIAHLCSYISPWTFALCTSLNASTLIHEAGHAFAAKAVYEGANPAIQIIPGMGGLTRFNTAKLSAFGERLGPHRSIGFVTAAGPLASLAASSVALAASVFTQEKYPKMSAYLSTASISDFISHASYAASALAAPKTALSHDFVRLSQHGLHPIAAAAAIAAMPILIVLGARALKERCAPPPPRRELQPVLV